MARIIDELKKNKYQKPVDLHAFKWAIYLFNTLKSFMSTPESMQ